MMVEFLYPRFEQRLAAQNLVKMEGTRMIAAIVSVHLDSQEPYVRHWTPLVCHQVGTIIYLMSHKMFKVIHIIIVRVISMSECSSAELTEPSGTITPPQLNGGFKFNTKCIWRIKVQ